MALGGAVADLLDLQVEIEQAGGISLCVGVIDSGGEALRLTIENFGRIDAVVTDERDRMELVVEVVGALKRRERPGWIGIIEGETNGGIRIIDAKVAGKESGVSDTEKAAAWLRREVESKIQR